jgi:hypothetical protein
MFIEKMVREAGVEPTTYGFGDRHSIQLSYSRNRSTAVLDCFVPNLGPCATLGLQPQIRKEILKNTLILRLRFSLTFLSLNSCPGTRGFAFNPGQGFSTH